MSKIEKNNIEDIFALTLMQEGMLLHYLKKPESTYFHEQLTLELSGTLNVKYFYSAWSFVVECNEMLRVVYRWENIENPVQIVLKNYKLKPGYLDFSNMEINERKARLEEEKERDRKLQFDLKEVPFRVTLCKIENENYVMIISNHHIIYDGWSIGIILNEFFKSYEALSLGKELVRFNKTKFKYYVKESQSQNQYRDEVFWREYLNGINHDSDIKNKKKPKVELFEIGSLKKVLPKEIKEKIDCFVLHNKVTIAALFYSVWGFLLQHYNAKKDILFDITVSGRNSSIEGIEETVGMFINTLPLRLKLLGNETILSLIRHCYEMVQSFGEFQSGFRMDLRDSLEEYHKSSFFDSVVVIENYPLSSSLMQKSNSLNIKSFSIFGANDYDVTVVISVFNEIIVNFFYNKACFQDEGIKIVFDHFLFVLNYFLDNPQCLVNSVTLPSDFNSSTLLVKDINSFSIPMGSYVAPSDEVEKRLVVIWSDIFRIDLPSISIDTNFFDFGGHSLKAKALAIKIRKEMNVSIPIEKIFKLLTIREIAAFIRAQIPGHSLWPPLNPVEKKEYYQLSSSQNRFFILHQMDSTNVTFNMPNVFCLEGKIDHCQMEKAFNRLIDYQDSFRTSFHVIEGRVYQRIEEAVFFTIDICRCTETELTVETDNFVQPFDLTVAPLFRVKLLQVAEEKFYLLMDIHHIISDGFSIELIIKSFNSLYQSQNLPPLRFQYKDYAAWYTDLLKSKNLKKQEKYWLEQLEEFKLSQLPMETVKFYNQLEGKCDGLEISRDLYLKIIDFCKEQQVTRFVFFLTVFVAVLAKEIDQKDITIGIPYMNRDHLGLEQLVGVFLNVLLIRLKVENEDSFLNYLFACNTVVDGAFENSFYPYEYLVEKIRDKNNLKRDDLFTILFNYFTVEENAERINSELKIDSVGYQKVHPKYDLTLYITEYSDYVRLDFVFKGNLFSAYRIKDLAKSLFNIVETVLENNQAKLSQLLTGEESVLGHIEPGIDLDENDIFLNF